MIPNLLINIIKNRKYTVSKKVSDIITEYDCKSLFVDNVNDKSFVKLLNRIKPDLIISAAYPQIFSKELLEAPILGAVNFHPSLLPKFRGAHPHFWTIVEGEKESGITAHFMTEKLDKGDIIAQIKFRCKNFTYSKLYDKIINETPNLISDTIEFFNSDDAKPVKQNDKVASFYRENRAIHRRIFWNKCSAEKIVNMGRTERCFFYVGKKQIRLIKASFSSNNRNMTNNVDPPNGCIVDISDKGVVVRVKDGFVSVEEVYYDDSIYCFPEWVEDLNLNIGYMLN